MALTFPAITPNYIKSIEFPNYKYITFTWVNKTIYQKRTQYVKSAAVFNIEYRNMSESNAYILINFYNTVQATAFYLPGNFLNLFPDYIKGLIVDWNIQRWVFNKNFIVTPQVMRKFQSNNIKVCRYDLTFNIQSVVA